MKHAQELSTLLEEVKSKAQDFTFTMEHYVLYWGDVVSKHNSIEDLFERVKNHNHHLGYCGLTTIWVNRKDGRSFVAANDDKNALEIVLNGLLDARWAA